ncbi:hypothetical protein NliqN6_4547 [Naganishia liquefaciens]|uniref:Uncharacterized protein n=1 Tax=Naganishia liquefaciens TaxID=104408 RepID=A0A8H3TVT6_9TREE|nr:hypothetical protein NliqN6_4547 [Naganishia liquefaciens]
MHTRIPEPRAADDAHTVAVAVAERALLEEGDVVADPWSTELSAKEPWKSSWVTVTLNTPPQIPTHTFSPSPFGETASPRALPSPGAMRPTAQSFMPPAQRTHSRSRSNLLPAIDLSHGTTITHRRAASSVTLSNAPLRASDVAHGDLPLPRPTTTKRQAGMPTLAEITAYYATKRTSPITTTVPAPTAIRPATSRRPLPIGGLAMLKRCSLSSETSSSSVDYSSAESDAGPQTPPARESSGRYRDLGGKVTVASERRESASRLPEFLRRGSESGVEEGKEATTGGYNALAMALARHRRTVSASTREALTMSSSMGPNLPPRSSSLDATTMTTTTTNVTHTPGIHVTPPSSTIPPSPTFTLPPTHPTRPPHHINRKLGIPHPTTLHTSLGVPGLHVTPPTASAGEDDTSPLLRLEAEIAATRASSEEGGKRQERAERMRRVLGMRTGGT